MLRFKKEDGSNYPEWQYTKLKDYCLINPKTENLSNIFLYIDLESVEKGKLLNEKIIEKTNAPSRAERVLTVGDVLFQTVRPYQMNHYIYKKKSNLQVVSSTGYAQLRVINGYNNFLYHLLYSQIFNRQVSDRCTGSSYPAISTSELSKIMVNIPCFEEQTKIANFLSNVDTLIEDTEKELESLKEEKKGVMQRIFSQELRFTKEDGSSYPAWEKETLNKLCLIKKGKQLHKNDINNNGKFYHLNGGITPSNYTNLSNTVKNTISISEGGNNCGFVKFNIEEFFSGGHNYTLLEISKSLINKFLYYYLKFFEKNIMSLRVGSGLPNIQKKSLEGFLIKFPCLEEQQKIVDHLSAYDDLIETTQKELDKLKEIKKGLMQQMFM